MWKDYSKSYIQQNKASSISVMAAALVSAFCLSLLCCLFYNFWRADVQQIIRKEGDWQGRITGELTEEDLISIQNFANVKEIVVRKEQSGERAAAADIYFQDVRRIYEDMPLILKHLELEESAASYHSLLLSRYLIHDPKEEQPPLLLSVYLGIVLLAAISLILIIHNSFAVSMGERVRQFGILSSVGAAPGQIVTCLMQEAGVLCAAPILLGSGLGILAGCGVVLAMNKMAEGIAGAYAAEFSYHPAVFGMTIAVSALTVLFSAWLPARRLSKLSPLQAIQNAEEAGLKRKKRFSVLLFLFGVEGELAGNALKARRKALRTSTLSLTLSFLAFTLMLCMFTLSAISTRHTYFEKYQNAWDVMVTVKDTNMEELVAEENMPAQNEGPVGRIRKLEDVEDCAAYLKASAAVQAPVNGQNEELNAPIVILDDESFLSYCIANGIETELTGGVVLNRIWDSENSNFRYKKFIPYIEEDWEPLLLLNADGSHRSAELPVVGYAKEGPVLREEYDSKSLNLIFPLSLWEDITARTGIKAESDCYIRVLGKENIDLAEAQRLEESIVKLLGEGREKEYEAESENRIEEKKTNDEMIRGYMVILGGFCVLLALIGMANVFSNTLGFVVQRKREFARYLSVGMTPEGLRKMFCIEALVIAGRPLIITLPLTILFVAFAVTASYLDPGEFLAEAPLLPIALFGLAIFGFVGLAYYIGGKRVLSGNLSENLRNDTLR